MSKKSILFLFSRDDVRNNMDRHDDDRTVDRLPHLRSSTPACSTDCSRQDWCSHLQPDLCALSGLLRLTWSFCMDELLLTHGIRNSNGDLSASDRLDHVSWRQRRPAAETEAVLCRCRGELTILIIITRPKPAYGRQGLAGSWGQDSEQAVTFWGVLNVSLCASSAQLGIKPTWNHKWG